MMQLVYLEVLLFVKLKLPRACKYRKFRNGAQLAFRSQYCGLVAISQNLTLLIFVMSRRPIHLIRIKSFSWISGVVLSQSSGHRT